MLLKLAVLVFIVAVAIIAVVAVATRMPRRSFRGVSPPLSPEQLAARQRLRAHVEVLAQEPRNVFRDGSLTRADAYIAAQLMQAGYADVDRQSYGVSGVSCANLVAEKRGGSEIVVVAAHYDTVDGSPGADDNASGVAAMIELARRFRATEARRTIRFAALVNEEPPFFQTEAMGARRYAQRCRERGETVVAMFSLESLGYYSERPQSQSYPAGVSMFYPSTADFLAFIGNPMSLRLVRRSVNAFRATAALPSEGAVMPELIPQVGWSDQWAFWRIGTPAVMVTDTAPFRNPHYHLDSDLPETLDYDRLTRAVDGLEAVVRDIAG